MQETLPSVPGIRNPIKGSGSRRSGQCRRARGQGSARSGDRPHGPRAQIRAGIGSLATLQRFGGARVHFWGRCGAGFVESTGVLRRPCSCAKKLVRGPQDAGGTGFLLPRKLFQSLVPHSWQNLESSSFSCPQAVHLIMMIFSDVPPSLISDSSSASLIIPPAMRA